MRIFSVLYITSHPCSHQKFSCQKKNVPESNDTRSRALLIDTVYNKMDAAAELGSNPVSKHQIQPEYGFEQADAGRDCRTRLARPNSQARTRTGKY